MLSSYVLLILITGATDCSYYDDSLVDIAVNSYLRRYITIKNVLEISFELKINDQPHCYQKYCHIFAISGRSPLIYTNRAGSLCTSFRYNFGWLDQGVDTGSLLMDGDWHSLYFKFTFYKAVIVVDNTTYLDVNGSFDFSANVGKYSELSAVWGNPEGGQFVHDGMIRNICIDCDCNHQETVTFTTTAPDTTISDSFLSTVSETSHSAADQLDVTHISATEQTDSDIMYTGNRSHRNEMFFVHGICFGFICALIVIGLFIFWCKEEKPEYYNAVKTEGENVNEKEGEITETIETEGIIVQTED